MPKLHAPHPLEIWQMNEVVRAGRKPRELGADSEISAQSIRNWVAQAAVVPGIEPYRG